MDNNVLDVNVQLTDGKGKISTIELPKTPRESIEHFLGKGGTVRISYEVTEIPINRETDEQYS